KYSEALEAYRTYFFDKLKNPEKYGLVRQNVLFYYWTVKQSYLNKFNPVTLEKNLNGYKVVGFAPHWGELSKKLYIGKVGEPGAVLWAPEKIDLPDNERDEMIYFYNSKVHPGDEGLWFFPDLLFSYTETGNKEHLKRWTDYMDDYTMNARTDLDNSSVDGFRMAVEFESHRVFSDLTRLRIILDERPELAEDFDAATLARMLMSMVTDYLPYTIRMRRSELANWGIWGITGTMQVAQLLHEYKAMEYFGREALRLTRYTFITHSTLDGENFEADDNGHRSMPIQFARVFSLPFISLSQDTHMLEVLDLKDQMRIMSRNELVRMTPDGNFFSQIPHIPSWDGAPYWRSVPEKRLTDLNWKLRNYSSSIFEIENGEMIKRIEALRSGTGSSQFGEPEIRSDISPYSAWYYIRDSWKAGAAMFALSNMREASQPFPHHDYVLFKDSLAMIQGSPLFVDQRPPNIFHGKIPTGGKTAVTGQAGRNVVDTRFHTSEFFDLAEAKLDFPYSYSGPKFQRLYPQYGIPQNIENDTNVINDVVNYRQVFNIRDEEIYIVNDRIENKAGNDREYAQLLFLPARVPREDYTQKADSTASNQRRRDEYLKNLNILLNAGHDLVSIDHDQQTIKTANPQCNNISVRFFGQKVTFGGFLNNQQQYDAEPIPIIQRIREAVNAKSNATDTDIDKIANDFALEKLSARWQGSEDQSLITVINTRPAVNELEKQYENDLQQVQEIRGEEGVAGFQAVTSKGTRVWFASGPKVVNHLQTEMASAQGETLLVIEKNGEFRGMVLGADSIIINGNTYRSDYSSFEYVITADGDFSASPISKPIDTVKIFPEQTAFNEDIKVSFDIPTQNTEDIEFRYTLDGSDPTIGSSLYTAPFTLDHTALVKVRPFRKGLDQTPWNMPGVDAGRTISAIFKKQEMMPALNVSKPKAGLNYKYFEDAWTKLFAYAGVEGALSEKKGGIVTSLLNASDAEAIRETDRAYAIRYEGYIKLPQTGVYSLYAPEHLYTSTMDAGYDLRVFIDGQEWKPNPMIHAENIWSIALEKGYHKIEVSYADYRDKKFRNEFWSVFPWQEEQMWQGTPVLEISGPEFDRKPIPKEWLYYSDKKSRSNIVKKEIAGGNNETRYDPKGKITRAEFTELIVKALKLQPSLWYYDFVDVNIYDWYSGIVQAAVAGNIISTKEKHTFAYNFRIDSWSVDGEVTLVNEEFRPNESITREEMTQMVMNAYKYKKGNYNIENIDFVTHSEPNSEVTGAEAAATVKKLLDVLNREF
ncbi:MAG TPA: hypothetical protein DCY35_07330, partial [Prolixibacteraceae bacterium]|nr:hypothetical protein [Prolixibacteraceae bacterium]